MKRPTRTATAVAALTAAALLVPAAAAAQDAGSGPVTALREALSELVDDGTLSSSQADRVAQALAERRPGHLGPRGGHGGPGHHGHRGHGVLGPDVVADALDLSLQELHAARHAGRTLTEIAADKGLSRAELVERLVAAARAELDEAVAEGRLTQEQAERRKDRLQERIEAHVDAPARGPGHRPAPDPAD